MEVLVSSSLNDLSVEDEWSLRETLRYLEEKCRISLVDQDQEQIKRKLWLHLIKISVELENCQLSLLVVAKLELVQLALLLRTLLQNQTNSNTHDLNRFKTISFVTNYFKIEPTIPKSIDLTGLLDSDDILMFECDELIEFYINRDSWTEAFELVDSCFHDDKQKELSLRLLFSKLAQQKEVDEEFNEALVNCERSTTHNLHLPRLVMKQNLDLSYEEISKYCQSDELQSFWIDYSIELGENLNEIGRCVYPSNAFSFTRFLVSNLDETVEKIFETIHEELKHFITDANNDKWFQRRKSKQILAIGDSLDSNSRINLNDLATYFMKTNCNFKAYTIFFCLNQFEAFFNLAQKSLKHPKILYLVNQFGSRGRIATNVIKYFNQQDMHQKRDIRYKGGTPFIACIKLGLIDEALCLITIDTLDDDRIIFEAIEHLEGVIEENKGRSLDRIDPLIRSETLGIIRKCLCKSNQILVTHVITIVILALAILLHKFIFDNNDMAEIFIPKLEVMFEGLAEFLDEMNPSASKELIRSVNFLVKALKVRLDALSDNEVIKERFRQIVETIAGRCMVESQYKSAAILYSHIEDNASAIKSLMRLGDIDVVINYSLLVRDITVNRITINYLKHLNVDSKVIADFVSRSKL